MIQAINTHLIVDYNNKTKVLLTGHRNLKNKMNNSNWKFNINIAAKPTGGWST